MEETKAFLRSLGLPDGDAHSPSTWPKRFPDGAQYRVQIPGVEGPAAKRGVVAGSDEFGVRIHCFVRRYEIRELVGVTAPVYLKFGLRNAPGTYPVRAHLEGLAVAHSRERVRRASIGLALVQRYFLRRSLRSRARQAWACRLCRP